MPIRPFLLLFSLLLSSGAWARPAKVTTVEGITEYRLDNGLRVLLAPDPTKSNLTVNITYIVGSRHEGYGEKGMAHLLEHLMFKGTPTHRDIAQELSAHGASPNGTTSDDRTNYYETFTASDENLAWALSLESDRMVNSYIRRSDLDSEMTVVRNEFERGENSPEGILEERTVSTAYLWHNYGNSTIGARSDLENVPIDRLQAFWRTYYQPDNAVLLVAGKLDEAKTLALIEKFFSPLPKPTRKLIPTYTREPPQDGERSVTLRRVGDVQAATVVYHGPATAHPDAAPLTLLTEILGTTPGGRLHKALVATHKASGVYSAAENRMEPGMVIAAAEVRRESSLDDAKNLLVSTMESVPAHPPTSEEVNRAKTSILKSFELTVRNTERLGLTLSNWIGMGDWRLFYLFRDRIRAVTPADVTRVAATYLKPSNRTLGLFIPTPKPDRTVISEAPAIASLVKDYRGQADVSVGEAFDSSPAAIEARVQRSTLPVGIKLALLPKKTHGGTIHASFNLHYGNQKSLSNLWSVEGQTPQMLMRGTKHHTRRQIIDELDRLNSSIGISGGRGTVSVSVETVAGNLEPVFRILAEILREPTFPVSELEELRQGLLASIEHQKSDPQALGSVALQRHLAPYPKDHPYYEPTLDERLTAAKALDGKSVLSVYKSFYGASNSELTVVGDFDPTAVKTLVSALFGDWKSPTPFKRIERTFFEIPKTHQVIDTPDKENSLFSAGLNLPLSDNDPDYPALKLGSYMLGGGFLNSRLAVRLRQKDGLSYGVGAYVVASALDPVAVLMAYAICAPQNAARAEKAFDEEVARVLKDGFTASETQAAKAGFLQSLQVSRAEDPALAQKLNSFQFIGRTLKWDGDFEAKISKLTPEEILATMRKHVTLRKISKVLAGDFTKIHKP